MINTNQVTVSIVSHGHKDFLVPLLGQLSELPEIVEIILTLNIPESFDISTFKKIKLIINDSPKGFGENHNFAFQHSLTPFFCILNPDISIEENPFPGLLSAANNPDIGLVAPMIKNLRGDTEDSARHFLTPFSLARRYFFSHDNGYAIVEGGSNFSPEWVAGMFMLFKSPVYRAINGFDEGYYLYVEDVDICTRLWALGYRILLVPGVTAIHAAQRSSHFHLRFLYWHVSGLLRYFFKYLGRFPRVY
ncbi:glycosyltransferase family 2 protein [Polynucleobacter sp. Ross1-W9]|uniref:galactosyltransferase-related protein n=1 Tax=Polynucleobacter parvulilacunae TaxID=1855631 RepID=UPI001C0BBF7E|nr:galactosyltransferase-related protein [Polynucleobacter parvulilacunae]MBU3556852.1 glycosyltransferase family 2 protein [Polynucleobacter parvulilacunae]